MNGANHSTGKLLVKVCGMREPANVQNICALGPAFMGFIFYPKSPRAVRAADVLPSLSAGIVRVGVFVNEAPANVQALAAQHNLQAVQLHGNEAPAACKHLKAAGLRVFKAFGIREANDFAATTPYEPHCELFVFDTRSPKHGGTGKQFDWSLLQAYTGQTPFLLSGGIGPADAASILSIQHPQLAGVDLNSRFEIEPGLKNVHTLATFMNELTSPNA